MFLVLAAAAAMVVVVRKGWAKSIARSVAMWVLRGDKDANAHMRHHDSALGDISTQQLPEGASVYNPPAEPAYGGL